MTTTKKRTQATRKPPLDGRAILDASMDEKDVQRETLRKAKALGYLCYHVFDSRFASANYVDKGFPDALLAKEGRVLAFEFKRERGVVSLAQHEWIYHLSAGGQIECYILRPHDLSSGRIEAILQGKEQAA